MDSRISVCSPRHSDVPVDLMQKTPELTASYTNTAKTIERMTTEKHISNFNLPGVKESQKWAISLA